jgi:lysophospholipase L1-like esterase
LAKIDWDTVSSFIEGIGATDKTITFPKVQDYVKVTNKGNVDVIYTIGSKSGTLAPNDNVEVKENISNFTVRASSGTSEVYVRASEAGTEKEEESTEVTLNDINSFNDKHRIVYGTEYLSSFHKKVMSGTATKVVLSGDSTTAGDSTTTGFKLNELLTELTGKIGLPNITYVNNGQSGKHTGQWETTYVNNDLTANPDVLILRWGINDPYYKKNGAMGTDGAYQTEKAIRRDVDDYKNSLRNGLSTIRSSRALSSLSIVLMSPNSTNDTPNGRDASWHESINQVIKEAAREFQCCFIDTYAMTKDAINAGDWMDNPYGDGRHIHPNNVGNIWITSAIAEVLFPLTLRLKYGSTLGTLEAVIAPTLNNSWVNYDTANGRNPGYYKDQMGIVHLQGMIKGGTTTANTNMFVLPVGYRPSKAVWFPVATNTGFGTLSIDSATGIVAFQSGGNGWLSLDGLTFRP